MSSSVVVVVGVLLCAVVFGPLSTAATPLAMYSKKSNIDCVDAQGKCFNTEECCGGLTCAAVDNEDDSAETPGHCVRAKNLTPCSTNADCVSVDEACSSLDDTQGQTYCLPTSTDNTDDLEQLLDASAPGQHVAYSKPLATYGGSCVTSADCQPYAEFNGASKIIRVCCQEVRRGRQGIRRACDRITPISICIQPPSM